MRLWRKAETSGMGHLYRKLPKERHKAKCELDTVGQNELRWLELEGRRLTREVGVGPW